MQGNWLSQQEVIRTASLLFLGLEKPNKRPNSEARTHKTGPIFLFGDNR